MILSAAECTRRIVAIEGAVKAICSRLLTVDPNNRTSKDLAEQCIKVSYQPNYEQIL